MRGSPYPQHEISRALYVLLHQRYSEFISDARLESVCAHPLSFDVFMNEYFPKGDQRNLTGY